MRQLFFFGIFVFGGFVFRKFLCFFISFSCFSCGFAFLPFFIVSEAAADYKTDERNDYRPDDEIGDVGNEPYKEILRADPDIIDVIAEIGGNSFPKGFRFCGGNAFYLINAEVDGAVINKIIIGAELAFVTFKLIADFGNPGLENDYGIDVFRFRKKFEAGHIRSGGI